MAGTMVELIQEGKDITTHLTDAEKDKLKACEQVIEKGFDTFLEVGRALAEIRDNRLYRETHKAFERYCREVWDFSKTHANCKIAGSEVVQNLTAIAVKNDSEFEESENILPANEAQTRPLTKLKPDDQVAAWAMVLEQLNDGKKLTSALVKKAVKQVTGDVVKKRVLKTTEAVERTTLVSTMFKKQFQVMLDIMSAERNAGWPTCSKKEMIRWFKELVKVAEQED